MKRTLLHTAAMLSGLLVVLTSLNAQAIMRSDEKRGSVPAKPNATSPSRTAGKIDSIDLGANTMVISGTSYLFLASSTKVYGAANAPGVNPLSLKSGMQIQFKTVHEPGSARPRITEIWTGGTTGEKK